MSRYHQAPYSDSPGHDNNGYGGSYSGNGGNSGTGGNYGGYSDEPQSGGYDEGYGKYAAGGGAGESCEWLAAQASAKRSTPTLTDGILILCSRIHQCPLQRPDTSFPDAAFCVLPFIRC
jgi:hypothetical protein